MKDTWGKSTYYFPLMYNAEQKSEIVWCYMDRRQRKTREAIFGAFIKLLSKKDFNQITVGEIIDLADVGRATFYSHFETKDYLLKELCKDLFDHVFESCKGERRDTKHIFDCDTTTSTVQHLLEHLQRNDNNVLELLAKDSSGLFVGYFKDNLKVLALEQENELPANKGLPHDYWVNHVASTFVETVKWWFENGMTRSAQEISEFFLKAIK